MILLGCSGIEDKLQVLLSLYFACLFQRFNECFQSMDKYYFPVYRYLIFLKLLDCLYVLYFSTLCAAEFLHFLCNSRLLLMEFFRFWNLVENKMKTRRKRK